MTTNLALQLEPLLAKESAERKRAGVSPNLPQISGEGIEKGRSHDTDRELGRIAGVSHDTIHKTKVVLKEGSEEIKEQVRSGARLPATWTERAAQFALPSFARQEASACSTVTPFLPVADLQSHVVTLERMPAVARLLTLSSSLRHLVTSVLRYLRLRILPFGDLCLRLS